MRRILAFALALLLLTACTGPGMAETNRKMKLNWTADPAAWQEWLTSGGMEESKAEQAANAIADIFSNLTLEILDAPEQCRMVTVSLKNEELLRIQLSYSANDDQWLLYMSLTPDLLVSVPRERIASASSLEAFSSYNWEALAAAVQPSVDSWLDGISEGINETGSFYGDAYAGGVSRYTWQADERNLAFLAMLLTQLPEVQQLFSLIGMESQDLQNEIMQAATTNRFSFMIREIYSAYGSRIGISLIMKDSGTQVATLSLGRDTNGAQHAVAGAGLGDANYYCEAIRSGQEDQDQFEIRLYRDRDRIGFAGAKMEAENLLGSVTASWQRSGSNLDYRIKLEKPGISPLLETGSVTQGETLSWTDRV